MRGVTDEFLRRAEALFEKKAPEPQPEVPRPRRRRVVRDRAALQPERPATDTTEQAKRVLDAQADALKAKLVATREQLAITNPKLPVAPAPAPPVPAVRRSRRTTRAVAAATVPVAAATVPVAATTVPVAARVVDHPTWRLNVVGPGAEQHVFFLVAGDVLEASSAGAREIATWMREHRPGALWRVESVEQLANVL